jgi:hypothetical protein
MTDNIITAEFDRYEKLRRRYPQEQGFYVLTEHGWKRALDVPLSHCRTLLDGKPLSILTNDFLYMDVGIDPWLVRSGLITDGLTIPAFLWWFLGHPYGRYLMAGVVHDRECAYAMSLTPGVGRDAVRARADRLFGEMCAYLTPDAKVAPAAFEAGVKVGALWTNKIRRRPPEPFYETDLVAAYILADIPHMIVVEDGRRQAAA